MNSTINTIIRDGSLTLDVDGEYSLTKSKNTYTVCMTGNEKYLVICAKLIGILQNA